MGPASPKSKGASLVILVGSLSGLLFASVMTHGARRGISSPADQTSRRRSRGGAAVSWAAWHEAWDGLAPRRLGALVVPALLAAPAGATVRDVVPIVAVYLPMLFVALLWRESLHVHRWLRRWLPPSARWWIASRAWRVVLAVLMVTVLAAATVPGLRVPASAK